MAKTRAQKEQTVAELTDKLEKMKGAVVVDFQGLKVKDAQKIRVRSWQEVVDYEVVKKSLLKLALQNSALGGAVDTKMLQGNIGIFIAYKDEIEAAKFAAQSAKDFDAVKILGGFSEGRFVDASAIKALASLPGRTELLAKLVGSIKSPISGFVNVLAGNLRGLVQVLKAIKEFKSAE
ncbi:MAG: 50S ribosomal protein L10 [Parcubacteria group bacterium GW2011_GWC2_45_7]|nr:MAG: 50S ribosomal protein L10 [Parcubacteria group bacterium GW2011_GWC2_45_7]KKU74030.1 MAG: 50S ribosomal protein L10 [Parcubacteria group bacterium GW2011_GWA2_47_26]